MKLIGLFVAFMAVAGAGSAEEINKSMIAVIPVQESGKDVSLAQPTDLRAGDWVAAWQAAREACPDAQAIRIYLKDRPGSSIQAPNAFECAEIKARGQVLIITARTPDKTEESIILVPAGEILRLEFVRKRAP